ncbi:hypothetical protein DFJ77DRAFT_501253 [Powellomyces hirtus]|nr:hypothetical protein DFJ77DRAFT_501253 [Powellomyces hirtus]
MAGKVSTAKGKTGATKSRQKYQNTFAFKPNKNNTAAVRIVNLPAQGLCQRCLDIIDWRKRMNKYKPLSQPKTCLVCKGKKITDAYHVLCKGCAGERNVCAKCQESTDIVISDVKTPAQRLKEQQEQAAVLASMSERQRRSYLRKMDRGDDEGAEKLATAAAEKEDGGWSDFDDDFGDDGEEESSDDQDEQ